MYKDSWVPPNYPGGGGFCVMKFTLQNLYEMHQYCSNWWTETNTNLPLCRYLGATFRFYQSKYIDYVIKWSTELPAVSNKLTYPSTQPSMMMMAKNKIIVPSSTTRKLKRPYKQIRIQPPAQLQNKWYFQRDIRETTLLILYASPVSLQEFYINTDADNNNITITYLNLNVIANRNFNQQHWPSKITNDKHFYIYSYHGTLNPNDTANFKNKQLIPLTNIRDWTEGQTFEDYKAIYKKDLNSYLSNIQKFTGNPFEETHIQHQEQWYWSHTGPATWATAWKTNNTEESKVSDLQVDTSGTKMTLTYISENAILNCRYNPFKDDGKTTQMYLLKCKDTSATNNDWNAPTNTDLILEGFPIWLNIWGFIDFQIRLGALQQIYTDTIFVMKTQATYPKITTPIVILDADFLHNKSPYETTVNKQDKNRWYPQVQYQTQQMNTIALTGPGSTKLPEKTSEQIVCHYKFDFKWGGNPPKMVTVNNPQKQIVYPLPSDEHSTNSLQNPTQAIETMLYSFDERHGQLTQTAIDRISKDWELTNILSPITERTGQLQAIGTYPQDPQTQETEKKEKEEILKQLIQHKQQQQQLRLRILQLMKDYQL